MSARPIGKCYAFIDRPFFWNQILEAFNVHYCYNNKNPRFN